MHNNQWGFYYNRSPLYFGAKDVRTQEVQKFRLLYQLLEAGVSQFFKTNTNHLCNFDTAAGSTNGLPFRVWSISFTSLFCLPAGALSL